MSSEATAKSIITRNSSEFKLDAYASIPAGELVVFAVQVLQADAGPVAVEEVVSTCFRLFPHSFALKNYFYWPDSALVSRRLHDAKEKGLLKGSAADGYETKVQGRQVAKHVAKTLSVLLPAPSKVEAPVVEMPKVEEAIVEKKEGERKETAPSAPMVKVVKKRDARKKEVRGKKKTAEKKQVTKPVSKKQSLKSKPKKETTKPTAPVKKKTAPKLKAQPKKIVTNAKAPVKQKQTKAVPKPKAQVKPAAKVEKKEETFVSERRKKKTAKTAPKAKIDKLRVKKEKSAQPRQLTMALPPVAVKKKAEVSAAKPKVKGEATVKGEVLTPLVVSKEEKDKAAKVVKQIERSDAYQLYKRNGRRAQIGEFDFRNMLFATMESSTETLKRNVELFKRYARIHFRTDLIAFLEFCEESFSALLISKAKVKGKR